MSSHICGPGCTHGVTPEAEKEIKEEFKVARRSFLRDAMAASGAAVSAGALTASMTPSAFAQSAKPGSGMTSHYYIPASANTILWGYFSKSAKPVVEVESGDFVTIETLTHHANDDAERMVKGDAGAESVFHWDSKKKGVNRRGAGPMDAKVGAGGGEGVHICTGPVYIKGAEPGDILEVRIIDCVPRPSANPLYKGRSFGSNAAANWGFHYGDTLTEPKKREVVTIYEVDATGERNWARAVYNYKWTPQTDPFGVVHPTIDYPGVPVDHRTITKNENVLKNIRIPVRPHFGTMGVAPAEAEFVTSIPPNYTGGNIDNWRIGKGATIYYPVAVKGAMFSVGDPHASQGDSELCGTAIECSLTGTFQLILHKKASLPGTPLAELNYPLLETQDEWLLHGFSYANYLAELGPGAQQDIYGKSSVDKALRDAYHKMRHFLMTTQNLSEDEAISLMSIAVDFGITQVVDGNWGVHALVKKSIFPARGT
ncbi:acetamidase [Aquabacterium soli]|uniref:Acetamidase n=1 Tax=Aquabacterium soli TaxID=2493092 RepID=A0A3R8T442_9BURK|nr:acetamidase/formamidase family protein [Aquabacterium soli]RRS05718.1 acetamidase [Aquabacterium soli]